MRYCGAHLLGPRSNDKYHCGARRMPSAEHKSWKRLGLGPRQRLLSTTEKSEFPHAIVEIGPKTGRVPLLPTVGYDQRIETGPIIDYLANQVSSAKRITYVWRQPGWQS